MLIFDKSKTHLDKENGKEADYEEHFFEQNVDSEPGLGHFLVVFFCLYCTKSVF